MALSFLHAELSRGSTALMVIFDETIEIMLKRASGMGLALEPFLGAGTLHLKSIDPAELSPGELTAAIQEAVEEKGVRLVLLDSLTGYMNAMPEEQHLVLQMHEILTYLNRKGVVTMLLLAAHGLIGQMSSPVDLTYLSDAILLLRFFEFEGRIRRAVSVLKKRTGHHEDTIREFVISANGISVGAPLHEFRGVLTGTPFYEGAKASLLTDAQSGSNRNG